MYDALSYDKGASVIRMLEGYLGPATFQRGLHQYLARFRYGNTVTTDLWNALEEASGQPVTAMMGSWTRHPGFPVISLGEGGEVTQRRCFASGAGVDEHVWRCVAVGMLQSRVFAELVEWKGEGVEEHWSKACACLGALLDACLSLC